LAERRFDIIFSGKLINGADILEVKESLRQLFKLDASAVEKLFAGNPVVIKTNIDRATASKYQQAIGQAGASIQLRLHQPAGSGDTASTTPPPATGHATQTPCSAQPTETGSTNNGFSLLPAGSDLLTPEERRKTDFVDVDTSHLHLDEITPLDARETAQFNAQLQSDPSYPGAITDTDLPTSFTMAGEAAYKPVSTNTPIPAALIKTDHLQAKEAQGYLLSNEERTPLKSAEIDVSGITLIDH